MRYERSLPLLGESGLARLRRARVLLLGLGGVGSYTAEALARAGIGHLTVVDGDVYQMSNLNRQLGALSSTIGCKKTDTTKARILEIDPEITVDTVDRHLTGEDLPPLLDLSFDIVLDAIDDLPVKIELAACCHDRHLPLITCLGTGNKWDPTLLQITDIAKTHTDPLARRMRKALRDRGIDRLQVIFSPEEPKKPFAAEQHSAPASLPFVPPSAGILLAKAGVSLLLETV